MQSDFVFYLNVGAVSWKGSNHDIVEDSTMKAEYIATSELQRKPFGSEILFLSWVLFLVHQVLWIYIVVIVEP
jgi:hypothetical protein